MIPLSVAKLIMFKAKKEEKLFCGKFGSMPTFRSTRLVFSTFLSCCQMSVVFYYSVIHGLGFFINFVIYIYIGRI